MGMFSNNHPAVRGGFRGVGLADYPSPAAPILSRSPRRISPDSFERRLLPPLSAPAIPGRSPVLSRLAHGRMGQPPTRSLAKPTPRNRTKRVVTSAADQAVRIPGHIPPRITRSSGVVDGLRCGLAGARLSMSARRRSNSLKQFLPQVDGEVAVCSIFGE